MEATALHVAALHESVQVMKVLLSAKCDVDERDVDGRTALHYAAECFGQTKKKQECIRLLLAYGASVNARTDNLLTPLGIVFCEACEIFDGEDNEDAIAPFRVLLEAGADVTECDDNLHLIMDLCDSMSDLCRDYPNLDTCDPDIKILMTLLELLIEHGVSLEGINNEQEKHLMSI